MSLGGGAALPHRIEAESYRLIEDRVDLSRLPELTRAVLMRVLHATADFSFVTSMVLDEHSISAGVAALGAGGPVVTDVEMVRAGIPGSLCYLGEARRRRVLQEGDLDEAPTLSALSMRIAALAHPEGAVFVVGCAPTALEELLDLVESAALRPGLVVGLPVGLVGAAAAKERLQKSTARPPAISNVGERGGSPAAAAVVNALHRLAHPDGRR